MSKSTPLEDWYPKDVTAEELDDIQSRFELSRPAATVLASRPILKKNNDCFNTSLANLSDPFRFPDMQKTVERIFQAIDKEETIVVHGDYDTDGVTSSTLLNWVLQSYGAKSSVFISNRLHDGYGPTPITMQNQIDAGASLVISTDCGITSFEAADYAHENGLDFIITDHHNPAEKLPQAFSIINPRITTELLDLYSLAGVGVSFKLCHALLKHGTTLGKKATIDLRNGLDLVALGTIADSCPLVGENRSLVKNGLKLLNINPRPGVRALYEATTLDTHITASDISRKISPKINAAGRVGDPMVSAKLLASNSIHESRQLVNQLKNFNRIRRNAEKSAYMEAFQIAKEQFASSPPLLLVVGPNWHPGVIGLLSTKLTKHFGLPSIVLSKDKNPDELLGSGRSCNSINLLEGLKHCSELLNNFGGHPMAAGLSLAVDNLDSFKIKLTNLLQSDTLEKVEKNHKHHYYDGEFTFQDLDEKFITDLEAMEPFGNGNDAPIFLFKNIQIKDTHHPISAVLSGFVVDKFSTKIPFTYYTPFDYSDFESAKLYNIIATPYRNYENKTCRLLLHEVFANQ
ncbi:single-stranded-DNA-specific exonuclease RecJ [Lentisphaera profundi]|uniref:Single-stranded-DNA-specific exonuclease RecJ n=1 Tax=Lentisphaera profundi TaxID=1658616 RepID=A0ABY7VRT3_9BACT|nr:single-stranded-DNA-specific exonuclease RecJ [Lentisphaera profundi]WDE96014.1 single-stranded-DNA-specific exonuclease RecJ [Lentisphaera profundi]